MLEVKFIKKPQLSFAHRDHVVSKCWRDVFLDFLIFLCLFLSYYIFSIKIVWQLSFICIFKNSVFVSFDSVNFYFLSLPELKIIFSLPNIPVFLLICKYVNYHLLIFYLIHQDLVPMDTQVQFGNSREQIKSLFNSMNFIKGFVDQITVRAIGK